MKYYINKQKILDKIKNYKGYFQDQKSSNHIILKSEVEDIVNDIESSDVVGLDIPICNIVYSIFEKRIITIYVFCAEIYDTYIKYRGHINGLNNAIFEFEDSEIGRNVFITENEAIIKLKEIKENNLWAFQD